MTGVLNTTPDWLALQWACNHLLGSTGFIDLREEHDPISGVVLEEDARVA